MAEPFWSNGLATLYQQDARQIPLPDRSVHCIVTSPPYYMLRVYKDADETCIGNEPTPEQYIEHLMQVMRECWRVLRPDGVCWVNLKDTWAGSGVHESFHANPGLDRSGVRDGAVTTPLAGRQQSCLFGVPDLFTQTMVREGWLHRDTIVWDKSVVKPESQHGIMWVRHRIKVKARPPSGWDIDFKTRPGGDLGSGKHDAQWEDCPGCAKCKPKDGLVLQNGSWRTTSKHELVFMFVKQIPYWSDGEAVKVPVKGTSLMPVGQNNGHPRWYPTKDRGQIGGQETFNINQMVPADRMANRRSVWSDIKAQPNMAGVHFASFPPDLPRLCIQASTSEKGCCPECGTCWARVVEKQPSSMNIRVRDASALEVEEYGEEEEGITRTIGWRAVCECGREDVEPALVLDPFSGTGTSLLAAQRLGRRSFGLDISRTYLDYSIKRLQGQAMPLALEW